MEDICNEKRKKIIFALLLMTFAHSYFLFLFFICVPLLDIQYSKNSGSIKTFNKNH
jgi:hypothetical protein